MDKCLKVGLYVGPSHMRGYVTNSHCVCQHTHVFVSYKQICISNMTGSSCIWSVLRLTARVAVLLKRTWRVGSASWTWGNRVPWEWWRLTGSWAVLAGAQPVGRGDDLALTKSHQEYYVQFGLQVQWMATKLVGDWSPWLVRELSLSSFEKEGLWAAVSNSSLPVSKRNLSRRQRQALYCSTW